jgi:hypothetical protein
MLNTILYPFLVTLNATISLATALKKTIASTCDDLIYYMFGYTDLWCFFENEHTPLQVRYIHPTYMNSVYYFYNITSNTWYSSSHNPTAVRLPWITATLHIGDDKYDLSEFIMNQFVRIDPQNPIYPTPDMLVAAWGLNEGRWFSFDERCDAVLKVMTDNCEDFDLPLIINSDDEVNIWGKSYGIDDYVRNVYDADGDESEEGDESDESESVAAADAADAETDISAEIVDTEPEQDPEDKKND